jgi:hypothetical protein
MTADGALLLSDDELLGALAAAFPVEPVEPDAAQLFRLSMAVAELRERTAAAATPAHPPAAARRQRWSLPRRFSPLVLAGAAVGVLGAGTGISYAVGVPVPAAVRDVARSVGLANPAPPPSTPTTLPPATAPSPAAAATAARQAESTLHQALSQSDPPPAVISHDSAVLAHRLFGFGGHPDAGEAGTTADGQQLLNEACRQLDGSAQATTGSDTSHATTSGPTATFPGCGPVGIWHDPALPTSPSSIVPSTTHTTRVPDSSHSGTGTGGSPFKAPVGGSSGTSSSGTRTGGFTGTTPGLSPGHDTGGSSGDRPGHGASSTLPSDTGTSSYSYTGDSHTGDSGLGTTNPRSGAGSG